MDLKKIDRELIIDFKQTIYMIKSKDVRDKLAKQLDKISKRLILDHTKQTRLEKCLIKDQK